MIRKYPVIHMIGIAGSGMCGIAEVLLNLGCQVTGSDLVDNQICERLRKLGGNIFTGHSKKYLGQAGLVVISSAIPENNPEILEAKRRKIPVILRAQMLAELMRMKFSIGIAGSHGKTTTSSMVAEIFAQANLDPTVIVGGRLKSLKAHARPGQGEFLVAEADESDGSFLKLFPSVAVATSVDAEHLNFYKDLEHLKEAFIEFLNQVPFYGFDVICLDDPNIQQIIPRLNKKVVTYGISEIADYYAKDITLKGFNSNFTLVHDKKELDRITLNVPGHFNILNSLAALAVSLELNIKLELVKTSLEKFAGVSRRFEKKAEIRNITIIDEYAHHPTEIKESLRAAREIFPNHLIFVLFQPHRYSRTKLLWQEFGTAFYAADKIFITEIYSANEPPIKDINGKLIADSILQHGHREVSFLPDKEKIPEIIWNEIKKVKEPLVLITFGAGDIWQVIDELCYRLKTA